MSERKLLVLYGTETGNAEDLAFDVGNLSKEFDLEAEVKGMDEVPLDGVISCKRLIICCSRLASAAKVSAVGKVALHSEGE